MRFAALGLASAVPLLALLPLVSGQTEQPPCLPGLTATPDGGDGITLAWPGVNGSSAYQVLFRTPTADWFPITPQVPAAGTTYTLHGVQPGVPYDFAVAAVDHGRVLATYCTVTQTLPVAVPLFASAAAWSLAAAGALAASLVLLRKR